MTRKSSNIKKTNKEGEYRGIRMRKWGKWVSEIRIPRSKCRLWLGSYSTAKEAARAYDVAVYCLRGPNAPLNFPNSPPRIPTEMKLSAYHIQSAAFEAASSIHSPSSHSAPPHDDSHCHQSYAPLNFPNSPLRIPSAIKLSADQIQSAAFEAASSIHHPSSHFDPPHDNSRCHQSSAASPQHNIFSPPISGECFHISDEFSGLDMPAYDVGLGIANALIPCEYDYLYFTDSSEEANDNLWSPRF